MMRERRLRIYSRSKLQGHAAQGHEGPQRFPTARPLSLLIPSLRFLGWSQKNLTHKRLWSLCHQHRYGVSDIFWLEHFVGIFSCVRAELSIDGAGGNDGRADIVRAELFCDGVGQTIQSPFRGGVSCGVGKG